MIRHIAWKDLLISRRESLMVVLASVCVALLIVGAFVGMQRNAEFAMERLSAERVDHDVWMNQGQRNPHSAAHFSRYAFRSASPLALVDPGIGDFAGIAIWMEAHFQNPAEFRRAEDSGELARSIQMSPATLFLIAMPLLVFVATYASIAGEREDGTLRQLIASGIGDRTFFLGKLMGGVRLMLPALSILFVAITAMALASTPGEVNLEAIGRASSMLVLYVLYLVCCVAIALGVSALSRTRQAALLALIAVWAVMTVLAPRLGTDLARTVHPTPDAREVLTQLQAASGAYYADTDRRTAIEQSVLEEYGVSRVEDLPIYYGAYVLQTSEELSFPEFERIYGSIARVHAQQNDLARALTLLSPFVVSRVVSARDSRFVSDGPVRDFPH